MMFWGMTRSMSGVKRRLQEELVKARGWCDGLDCVEQAAPGV
jgi:hypothetical protein